MANENLKNALRDAGLTPEEFAAIIQVDPKSVQRWVAGATTPYRRHRAAISRALNLEQHELWPDQAPEAAETAEDDREATEPVGDVAGAWGYADHEDAPDLREFITDTTGPIAILDSFCGIEITAEIIDALRRQADAGTKLRILTDGRAPHWEPLLAHPEIKVYLSEIPGEYWLIKSSDRMLLTINLDQQPGTEPPPLIALAAGGKDGLFRRLASKFEQLWQLTGDTKPCDPPAQPTGPPAADRDRAPAPEPPLDATRRRWPRQPG